MQIADASSEAPGPQGRQAMIMMGIFVVCLLVAFGTFTEYNTAYTDTIGFDPTLENKYAWFQDVHIMIFIGFGFLMAYLKHHGFSSTGFNYLVAVVTFLWSILTNSFFHQLIDLKGNGIYELADGYTFLDNGNSFSIGSETIDGTDDLDDLPVPAWFVDPADTFELHKIGISIDNVITSDFTAAACLISFGAILGKVNPSQLLVMIFFECIFFGINEAVGANMLAVSDVGGSIFVHLFGAVFGVCISKVITTQEHKKQAEKWQTSSTNSDLFAMVGSIFLFCFWPSFNGALASGEGRHRVVINTVISLCGSATTTFMMSGLLSKERKYLMEHIQNAALAGGVAVGSSADLRIEPWGALLIGCFSGIVSTFGFARIKPWAEEKLGLHDTCGVLQLHGIPAVIGAMGGVFSSIAAETEYSCSQYAATAPSWSDLKTDLDASGTTKDLFDMLKGGCTPGLGRTMNQQAAFQFAATMLTIVFAAIGGFLTGFIMKLQVWKPPTAAFRDNVWWEVEEDEEISGGMETTAVDVNPKSPIFSDKSPVLSELANDEVAEAVTAEA